MSAQILCPHCRSPIDPQTLDFSSSGAVRCLICSECDGILPVSGSALPAPAQLTLAPVPIEASASPPAKTPCPLTL